MEINELPAYDAPLESIDIKGRLGIWGCQASHIKAMHHALENTQPDDKRWIIILEDDVKLEDADKTALLAGLENAPEDAGMLMLTSQHRLWQGAVPVATEKDEMVKPIQATSTAAIAFRPEMLRRLLPVYEANLAASAQDGGVIAVDHVNCILQEWQTLGNEPPESRPEMRRLVNVFKDVTADKPPLNMYALNPSIVPVREIASTIGEVSTSSRMRIGSKLRAVAIDTARHFRKVMPGLEKHYPTNLFSRAEVDGAVIDGSRLPEEAVNKLETMAGRLAARGRL